ncbi:MAG: IS3 family transposase [Niabella sp.]|nr:IS3 family transposase [Niabella sp.]
MLCGMSRQAHFKMLQRRLQEQQKSVLYIGMMEQVRQLHPGMGLRTMYAMLQPEGIGRDHFIALGLQEGFRLQSIEKQVRTTYSVKSNRYRNLLAEAYFDDINQLWSSDITYYLLYDQFFYIVFIMDVYSRRILGYSLADNMRAENNVRALQQALKTRGIKDYDGRLIHHSDRGAQYISDAYTDLLEQYGIRISMCNEVYENTHIERINDTIKNQYLRRWNIKSTKELACRLSEAIVAYNELRPHLSLGKLSPVQYEKELEKIEKVKRKKMKIFTMQLNNKHKPHIQLDLFKQV